jgi:streptogramin lyase
MEHRADTRLATSAFSGLWFGESRAMQNHRGDAFSTRSVSDPGAGRSRVPAAGVPRMALRRLILTLLGVSVCSVASGQVITEFPVPTNGSSPFGIVAGPDGNLWFTESAGNQIGRITTAGVITEFPIPTASSDPRGITAGPDGNLWFVENSGNKIGRITTAGVITEFPITTPGRGPFGITAGPDGNLWFTENSGHQIGRITTAGVITEFPIPTAMSFPYGIAAGSDGNLWFTENRSAVANNIGRITTVGFITEFPIPTAGSIFEITAGPDGNLWFVENANQIGRITTAGVITEFPIPTAATGPIGITAGPDGNLWFTENSVNQIARITTAGVITEFPIPTATSGSLNIAAGPDGNLWFTEFTANQIGRITTAPLTPQVMEVDARFIVDTISDINGVFEPGETVQVDPYWKNTLTSSQNFILGAASNFSGPPGPTYTFDDNLAEYGTISAGATGDCDASAPFTGPQGSTDCYLMTVSGARPSAHWDAEFTETLSPSAIAKTWTLHLGDSFPDVPRANQFYRFIETLLHHGVTGGCGNGNFCPDGSVTRAQMAVFLLKSKFGADHVPPPETGAVFNDVHVGDFAADWIEQLGGFQITGGCGSGNYCPNNPVTRAQMAVFLLKSEHGSAYTPPPCAGVFLDVLCSSPFAPFIEQLFAEGITGGCGGGNFCPNSINLRGQMAVFLSKAFGLALYGP